MPSHFCTSLAGYLPPLLPSPNWSSLLSFHFLFFPLWLQNFRNPWLTPCLSSSLPSFSSLLLICFLCLLVPTVLFHSSSPFFPQTFFLSILLLKLSPLSFLPPALSTSICASFFFFISSSLFLANSFLQSGPPPPLSSSLLWYEIGF